MEKNYVAKELTYLVRLDCFSNVFNWWVIASNIYIWPKYA